MKTLVVLFAGSVTSRAFEGCFDGRCACERALAWAQNVPGAARLDVYVSEQSAAAAPDGFSLQSETAPLETVFEKEWHVHSFLTSLAARAAGFDCVVLGWADCPFYDPKLTAELLDTHLKYAAEYAFADGYPAGLVPETIHPGTLKILAELAKDDHSPLQRDSLFTVIKKDINAFEIETLVSPADVRYLRLDFACKTKRGLLACRALFDSLPPPAAEKAATQAVHAEISAADICVLVAKAPAVQRTLPAFYAIQIAAACNGRCVFCPYQVEYAKKYGLQPSASAALMPLERFRALLEKIAAFSGDAVISLSLWGESTLHPQFTDFVEEVLKYPSLSLLIETDGLSLAKAAAEKTAALAGQAPERTNGQAAVNWIIGLDAAGAAMYEKLHGRTGFETAVDTVRLLLPLFPGAVYPQFVRLKDNEEEMEAFYRAWKAEAGNVIIQKYDWFSGLIEDRKVADLTPVNRAPCWHLCRDMYILCDGSVPRCRTEFFDGALGNAFEEPLEAIWLRGAAAYAAQLDGVYSGLCEKCDEYYTFNF